MCSTGSCRQILLGAAQKKHIMYTGTTKAIVVMQTRPGEAQYFKTTSRGSPSYCRPGTSSVSTAAVGNSRPDSTVCFTTTSRGSPSCCRKFTSRLQTPQFALKQRPGASVSRTHDQLSKLAIVKSSTFLFRLLHNHRCLLPSLSR